MHAAFAALLFSSSFAPRPPDATEKRLTRQMAALARAVEGYRKTTKSRPDVFRKLTIGHLRLYWRLAAQLQGLRLRDALLKRALFRAALELRTHAFHP
jgi:hypothetical protein